MQNYYTNDRKEVIKFIPETAARVLDVGCGEGSTLALIKSVYGCETVGVELDEKAARNGIKNVDSLYNFSAENHEKMNSIGFFDVILLLDVLEHMIDPWSFVKNLKNRTLKSGGTLIASIPNARNYLIIQSLLRGDFRYSEAGLFDRTHLRWFTKKNMYELFADAGLEVELVEPSNLNHRNKATVLNKLTLGFLEEYLAFQYILVAKNPGALNEDI